MSRWMRFVQVSSSLVKWRPQRAIAGKVAVVLGMALVGGVAFGLGRWIGLGTAAAQTTPQPSIRPITPTVANAHLYNDDYTGRVVAYINGNIPIYRAELAEYLIARFGTERLEFLVNRRIVEQACQAKGITVTDTEVDTQFQQDIQALGVHMTAAMFYEQVLKRYNKSIFEWKEDVIRPKLAVTKLVRSEVYVNDDDLHKGFEIRYGPKVQCRMAFYQNKNLAIQGWERIRTAQNIEAGFLTEAKAQFITQLNATAGELPPIHKHFGSAAIEREAFGLKPGEISQVIGMPDNTAVILFCEKHLPRNLTKNFDAERPTLYKEIFEEKLAQQIQDKVVQLRRESNPRLLLARQANIDQVKNDAKELIESAPNFKSLDK